MKIIISILYHIYEYNLFTFNVLFPYLNFLGE